MRSSDRTEEALARRVATLDAEPQSDRKWLAEVSYEGRKGFLIGHFVAVMSSWTDGTVEIEAGPDAAITPAAADALTRDSRLLADIARFDSSVVAGPINSAMQQWTPVGRAAYTGEPPNSSSFVAPQAHQPAAVMPACSGMYTSTVCLGGLSMWRVFLGPGDSAVLPWKYTWNVGVDEPVTVAEITSATRWAEFVCAHARYEGDMIYPDWVDVARSFDGVHITLPTIAATQGFAMLTPNGMVAPAFWDVETTFWVKWRLTRARMVENIDVAGES